MPGEYLLMKLYIQTPWITIAMRPARKGFCGDEKFPNVAPKVCMLRRPYFLG